MNPRKELKSDPSGFSTPPASYGLIEGKGMGRTDIDGDSDAEFFEICSSVYGDEFVKVFYPRENNA